MSGVETEIKPVAVIEPTVSEPVHQQPHDSHDEEYESADDAYEEEEVEVEEEVEEEEEEEEERSPSQQEQEKELDDDEDVKNPQFIPKRGYFYEHDDRTKAEEEEEVVEEPKKEEKKLPIKEPTKWSHDLYDENEQTPKSKDELSRAYGYDIFTEEQAPRARRRRRYGRGPNKYTRQWEDEEAYQKPRGGGFRGRGGGSRGRGNFRGSNRQGGDENHVEEEFPALPGSETTSKPSQQPTVAQQSKPKEHQPPPNRGSGEHSRPQHQHENRRRSNDYDNERNYGPRGDTERSYGGQPRGGRGGGPPGGGGRGRGRRNEFSNRNRYPNRRDGEDDGGNENQQQERGSYHQNQTSTSERERPANRPRPAPASQQQGGISAGQENKDNISRPRVVGPTSQPQHSQQQTNGHVRDSRPLKDSPLPSKPPFTNTEYTGSHSLTANRGASNRPHQNQGHHHHDDQQQQQQGRKGPHDSQSQSNVLAEKGFTDLRDVLNAKRQQQHQPGQSSTDRRSQMPPRLQQQQQQSQPQHQQQHLQQHHHQQQQQQHHVQGVPLHHPHHHHQQQQPPHQHQMQQLMEQQQPVQPSGKPKRFSAQRQRQAEQSIPTTSVGGGIQTSVPMGHVPPNMMPVVSGSEQMVPSPVPGYPQQAPTYYEGPQGYETSGSPVTVATATNGASVSPSLWTPHAYASNAPYPSPPTGPQVPQQAAFADHAAFIAAQQAGPPIYSAPPPFIQDPGMLNYNTGAPPFAPAYHPQAGYQGFPQVTPAPPPELYHAGVTYYNPQPQLRPPPMMAPKPRTKLQLVEPPEKNKGDRSGSQLKDLIHHQQLEQQSQSPPLVASPYATDHTSSNVHGYVEQSELVEQFENVSLAESSLERRLPVDEPIEQMRKPSPLPEQQSWSAQMDETNDAPEDDCFEPTIAITSTTTEVVRPPSAQPNVETSSPPSIEPVASEESSSTEKPKSPKPSSTPPPPQTDEAKKDGEQ